MQTNGKYISKHEAGVWLGTADSPMSPRRVLELAKDGKLDHVRMRDPNTGQTVVRILGESVERYLEERKNPIPIPDPPQGSQPSSQTSRALARSLTSQPSSQTSRALVGLLELARDGRPRPYLTIDAASEYSGLGAAFLRRQIADGKLQLLKGAGIRGADVVRRADLEKL